MNFKQLWSAVESNPLFVAVSSAVGGALLDLIKDYLTTGTVDFSPAGIKKMTGYVVTAVLAAILHLYRPTPAAAKAAKVNAAQKVGVIALIALLLSGLTGCPQQSVLAALTATLGNAAASIATIQGDPDLAQKLQTDTAAATAAIQNWKQGTPAQAVVQALTIVEDDLNLISQIPGAQEYAPLITLAISTAISIIEIVDPGAVPVAVRASKVPVISTGAPKSSKEFKTRWNAICASNAKLAGASIK